MGPPAERPVRVSSSLPKGLMRTACEPDSRRRRSAIRANGASAPSATAPVRPSPALGKFRWTAPLAGDHAGLLYLAAGQPASTAGPRQPDGPSPPRQKSSFPSLDTNSFAPLGWEWFLIFPILVPVDEVPHIQTFTTSACRSHLPSAQGSDPVCRAMLTWAWPSGGTTG